MHGGTGLKIQFFDCLFFSICATVKVRSHLGIVKAMSYDLEVIRTTYHFCLV